MYAKTPTYADKEDIIKFTGESKLKTLTPEEIRKLEREISHYEVSQCLKNTRNNVAPGDSGFTGYFYKVFLKLLSSLVTRAINKLFEQEYLSIMQKMGIITMIPKGDKDLRLLSNWRPLILLNTFYKLISSILAIRLKPVFERIVGHEQKAYIPSIFIGEDTRTTYDLFQYAKQNN